jgi:hypothetical protein
VFPFFHFLVHTHKHTKTHPIVFMLYKTHLIIFFAPQTRFKHHSPLCNVSCEVMIGIQLLGALNCIKTCQVVSLVWIVLAK